MGWIPNNKTVLLAGVLLMATLAGCIEPGKGETLSIGDFHFCAGIRGLDMYDEHPNTFKEGEQIFMYFELTGFEKKEGIADIIQTLTIITPEGDPFVLEGKPVESYVMIDEEIPAKDMDVLWFDNHLPPVNGSWAKGTYDVKIAVTDRVAEKTVSYNTEFIIL